MHQQEIENLEKIVLTNLGSLINSHRIIQAFKYNATTAQ